MSVLLIVRGNPIFNNTDLVLLAYLGIRKSNDYAPAIHTDFSTIVAKVIDNSVPATPVQIGLDINYDPSVVIHDTVQTGTIWPIPVIEAPGFNFDAALPRAFLPVGGKPYTIQIDFTLASGLLFHVWFVQPTKALLVV